jgi:hypothetical protein
MRRIIRLYRGARSLPWLSPAMFLLCAGAFAVSYAALHLAGLRSCTSVFCGTFPADRVEQVGISFFGVSYTLFYMLAVLVSPILVIAAGVFALLRPLLMPAGRSPCRKPPDEGTRL